MHSGPNALAPKFLLVLFGCAISLVPGPPAAAQEAPTGDFTVAATQGREVVVLPTEQASGAVHSGRDTVYGYAFESGDRRVHVIEFEGEVFRAATPLQGPASRIAFDPSRRTFVPLLPSIRVEAGSQAQLKAIGERLGAGKSVYFDKLGFGIIDLPEDMHPLEAIAQLESVAGQPRANIRLRRPPIEWR
ncbi:MAG: hypothetical protein OXC70_03605 [Gammaproteobacteria bacterium]|nr:hypothetical protein [Gammaproteobacteria bacterium]